MKYAEYNTNGNTKGRSAAEIELDLTDIRHEMSDTIQRLEERFSPRSLLDVAFSRARGVGEGSTEFVSNLGSTIRDHPVPVLLMAAGVASLIASERRGTVSHAERAARRPQEWDTTNDDASGESKTQAIKSKAHELGGAISERASEVRERAGEMGERASEVRERAGAMGERASEVRERAGEMGERAKKRGVVVRDRMRGAVAHARSQGSRALHEEPMVIVGVGLALGALFGAATPISERERRAVGAKGGRVIDRAKEAVGQGVERAREITERVTEESASLGSEEQASQATPSGTRLGTTGSPAGGAARDARGESQVEDFPDTPPQAPQRGRGSDGTGGGSNHGPL